MGQYKSEQKTNILKDLKDSTITSYNHNPHAETYMYMPILSHTISLLETLLIKTIISIMSQISI